MITKYLKALITYGAIVAAGLAIGWGAPRLYERLKPAYTKGDYSTYFAGTGTNVIVYGTPTCPYCAQTRDYLREHHIEFADLDVTSNTRAKADFARLGSRTVPVVLIGARRIDGYKPSALQDALEAVAQPVTR